MAENTININKMHEYKLNADLLKNASNADLCKLVLATFQKMNMIYVYAENEEIEPSIKPFIKKIED